MAMFDRVVVTWVATRSQPTKMARGDGTPPLSRPGAYADTFDAADGMADWCRPWIGEEGSFSKYWEACFNVHYERTGGARAWRSLTPLRERQSPDVKASTAAVELGQRRYATPTGVAVELSAEVLGPIQDRNLLRALYELSGANPAWLIDSRTFRLPAAIGFLLDDAEVRTTGRTDPHATSSPVRAIVTLTGTTDWPSESVTAGSSTQRLLEALARQSDAPLTEGHPLPALDRTLVDPSRRFPATLRYVSGDAAVIASPAALATGRARGLVCYHRNIALSTLRCDSLLAVVQWAATQPVMHPDVTELVRLAVIQLSLAWGRPTSDAYRSAIVRQQIDNSGLRTQIDAFRASLSIGPNLT